MSARTTYEFGPFCLDPANRVLRRGSEFVLLTPKAFQTLLVLVENRDRIVDKSELSRLVWPNTFTEQSNLPHQILAIRKALGEFQNGKHYIETFARRGYRFTAAVEVIEEQQLTPAGSQANKPVNDYDVQGGATADHFVSLLHSAMWRLATFVSLIVLMVGTGLVFTARILKQRAASQQRAIPERVAEARRHYQQGRLSWEARTPGEYKTAITEFQQAIKFDPNYAEAYAGLADSYILLGSFGIESPNEVVPLARAAALRAIELNDRASEAHASMGYLMSRFDWDWQQAEREFRRALELDPKNTTAHQWYALHLVTLGRTEEAISQIRTAQSLDPTSLVLKSDTALVLFYARRYEEAAKECRQALQRDASFGLAHRTLGAIYVAQSKYLQAISEFEIATRLLGRDPWMIAETGRSYALLEQRQEALSRLRELHQMAATQFVSPSAFALLSASLPDRRNESLEWLEKEFDRHANVAILTVHPGFDPIRHDPRFEDLLRRIGLPSQLKNKDAIQALHSYGDSESGRSQRASISVASVQVTRKKN
jgi:DNA-binding winged helix-turn-helix (wHTH) protein/Tfp pilus assembly protein PilF